MLPLEGNASVLEELPAAMSFTITVPPEVPSLFQSSLPFVPSSATKKRVPLTSTNISGALPPLPDLMSLTITVPAAVPSLFQSSFPLVPSLALKKNSPLETVKCLDTITEAIPSPVPELMSLIMTVPPSVPSLLQSSLPVVASPAIKKSVPLTSVRKVGVYGEGIFFTSSVPNSVPSVFHRPGLVPRLL